MSAIKLAKKAVRQEIDNKIGSISKEDRKIQSEVIRNKVLLQDKIDWNIIRSIHLRYLLFLQLFKLEEFTESQNVSIFLSLDTEVDTEPIVRKLFETGKKCFVPR